MNTTTAYTRARATAAFNVASDLSGTATCIVTALIGAVLLTACADPPPPTPLPADSLYQVTGQWQDQAANPRTLAQFRGAPVVVSMIFTHCQYACPRLIADIKRVEKRIAKTRPETAAQVRYLLVSMDHERDLPARLRAFASEHKLDLTRWTLLHGGEGDIRVLNAVLGGKYKQAPSGDFAHSNLIGVLDRDGRIVLRQEGLGGDPEGATLALQRILDAPR